ncbi:MBL fold metallo-hydrolase [Pelosinus fermentans]|uniref:Beta-lactamase domain protein n=1 Tax=Pelosinus fermentans JBW45 TaxID=1192197 RepID=I8TR29_9FIRM|nr:MBL fold metallo-hydrolase [Pelosinus fermentans]AJQ25744.1 beta-lactamase domain protein [Pelosinus fermentans JBW45]
MDRIIDVTGGKGGNAFLLLGAEKTALIDCGMAYCASNLIKNIKHVLCKRTLDYICISHSHYDHIGAIPYLKAQWSNSKVLGAEYAKQILNKPNALKLIRSLSMQAAQIYGADSIVDYDDAMMKVDRIICDGDVLNLGSLSIKVIETRGHTKCSLSFLIDNDTLFPSESTGYMSKSGKFYPAFLTSCSEAVDSIHRCQKLNPQFIISPHFGLVNESDKLSYWENCLLAVKETKEFILRLASQGYDEEQILTEYEKVFRDEQSRLEQPAQAFLLNARSMIKTVLREEVL